MDKLRRPAVTPLLPRGGLSGANAPDQPILHGLSYEEGHLVPPRTFAGLWLPNPGASSQMMSDLLETLHHACETLPQATRELISRDVDRGRLLLRSALIDHAAAVACALVRQIEPLTRRGGQAINASKAGGRGKAKAAFRANARAEATRIWMGVPLRPISEVARRVRRSWLKSSQDNTPIPAERTIRRWIADLAPARETPQ